MRVNSFEVMLFMIDTKRLFKLLEEPGCFGVMLFMIDAKPQIVYQLLFKHIKCFVSTVMTGMNQK